MVRARLRTRSEGALSDRARGSAGAPGGGRRAPGLGGPAARSDAVHGGRRECPFATIARFGRRSTHVRWARSDEPLFGLSSPAPSPRSTRARRCGNRGGGRPRRCDVRGARSPSSTRYRGDSVDVQPHPRGPFRGRTRRAGRAQRRARRASGSCSDRIRAPDRDVVRDATRPGPRSETAHDCCETSQTNEAGSHAG